MGVAGIGARTTSAISVVKGAQAVDGQQAAETAWAWYHGDSTKCIRHEVQKDVCKDTPSALSDAMSMHFETSLHYGHSIARVKVQQVLAILQSDLVTPSADRSIADLKMDIVAHMLIPHYQGAIHAAHEIDIGQRSNAAKADGAEHWKVINAAVTSFSASGKMNFCTVQALLLKNLPGGSNLQYGSNDCIKEGCKEIGTHTPGDDATKHVTEEDVGILKASREGDAVKDCSVLAMPAPSVTLQTRRPCRKSLPTPPTSTRQWSPSKSLPPLSSRNPTPTLGFPRARLLASPLARLSVASSS